MSESSSTGARSANGHGAGGAPLWLRLREWVGSFRGNRGGDESLREDLEELLEEHAEGENVDTREQRAMLENVLSVGSLRVDDVMVPRADIVAIADSTPLDEVVRIFEDAGHSRMPVYRGTLDDVLGMIHVKDLLRFWFGQRPERLPLAKIVRRVLFVPPSMPVLDLLIQMRAARQHMALVVDEYGGIDGLVTIEDLVEQIVGDIDDEYDETEAPMLVERPDGSLDIDARCPIEDLEERLGHQLLEEEREEDIDTIGGLVFALLGRVPRRGELVRHPAGLEFEVLDADPRRVKRLRLARPTSSETPALEG